MLRLHYKLTTHATIGICFGHQIIAHALGAECVLNVLNGEPGGVWELGPTKIHLTEIGKQLFGSYDTLVCRTNLNTYINHLRC